MICKDDLVLWFKNLESYRRIDVMCTLLNLCLPFELRFLGTCLEELGRRDAQDLRGVELRVNNPLEFVSDVGSFQTGQPTDMKIRRKMALYLALMRACNRTGVNELFKTLDRWGDRDFSKFGDGDSLQELLLVYTMATNHPVFSFEQRQKCGEIFSKITSSRGHQQQSSTRTSPITSPPPFQSGTFQPQPPSASQQQLQMNQAATQLANPILMPIAFQPTVSTFWRLVRFSHYNYTVVNSYQLAYYIMSSYQHLPIQTRTHTHVILTINQFFNEIYSKFFTFCQWLFTPNHFLSQTTKLLTS